MIDLFDPRQRRLGRQHLSRSDPKLAALLRRHGDVFPRRPRSRLRAMMQLVIDQQISVHAARAIRARLHSRLQGRWTASAIAALSDDDLGLCGLSRPKQRTTRALLDALDRGELEWRRIGRLEDAEVIRELTRIKGIGPWTAQMYLLFALGRADVMATGDLGLQNAAMRLYGLRQRPDAARFERLAQPWAPYRSLASVYLWASLEKGNWQGVPVDDELS